jgi:hypothetical protein
VGERSLVLWHVETNAVCIYSQLKSFSNFEIAAMIGGLALVDVSNEYEEAMNNRSLLGLIAADISLGVIHDRANRPRGAAAGG